MNHLQRLCALALTMPITLANAGATSPLSASEFSFQTSAQNTAPYIVYLNDPLSKEVMMSATYIAMSTLEGMCDDDLSSMDAWASIEGESKYRYSDAEIAYQMMDDDSMPFNPFPNGLPAAGMRGKPVIQGDQTYTWDSLSATHEMILREYGEL